MRGFLLWLADKHSIFQSSPWELGSTAGACRFFMVTHCTFEFCEYAFCLDVGAKMILSNSNGSHHGT